MSYRLGLLLIGFMIAALLFVAVEFITSPPDEPFPSWRPPPAPTPTEVPRTLRTAGQVAP